MTAFPSQAPTEQLSQLFPTLLPDPEKLVYEYVKDATEQGLPSGVPSLSYYADRARSQAEGLTIPVVPGWPAYPGKVPAIGVAAGPETEDQQNDQQQGGFVGSVVHHDEQGNIVGGADYYSEPLYATVIVELIHENRDERDRLHNELRRLLFPLRTALPAADAKVKRVRVDAEKTESSGGPPVAEQPFTVYISIFTVHVYFEMLEARNVVGPESFIARIDVSASGADTGA